MYLDNIISHKKEEIRGSGMISEELIMQKLSEARPARNFKAAIEKEAITLIAEIKFRSPSKGILHTRYSAAELGRLYEENGASAISVLAEQKFFGGSSETVRQVANDPFITIPVMYKDFIVDPIQIYQARCTGADAVLLIARAMSPFLLRRCVSLCRSLGMTPLVETFNREDLDKAIDAGAEVIGINNRDLQSFKVDFNENIKLRRLVPNNITVVSESGISSRADVLKLEKEGFSSMLIGESILTSEDPAKKIKALIGGGLSHPKFENGYLEKFGGRYTAETLESALHNLKDGFTKACIDSDFVSEFERGCREFIGRETPLTELQRLSQAVGGARIFAKREDLAHTGAHKINNAYGQALLAKRLGKTHIIAETGAGQHGVAVATVCARLGLKCTIYMGAQDIARQEINVMRMKLIGADVKPVNSGTQTLKDAVNEATRDWISRVETSHYILGSAVGPDPYPEIVRYFQSVIGKEARQQIVAKTGRLPDAVIACVGGGSNAIGIFSAFIENPLVELAAAQAGGAGIESGKHAAPLVAGTKGIFQGAYTYILQDDFGQILDTHSVAPGLDYAGAGPEHSYLKDIKRVRYEAVNDSDALDALQLISKTEGILPALESAHAVALACKLAAGRCHTDIMLVNISGRGDKDLFIIKENIKI